MSPRIANQLTSLKVHEAAFTRSVADMEERKAAPAVLGIERKNLENIRRQIAEIEKAEAAETPAPIAPIAPEPPAPAPADPPVKPLVKKK